jgi:hypothetical protein
MVMEKLGRNDECHCGSGKKYKKCHLPLEETKKHIDSLEGDPQMIDRMLTTELSSIMEKEMTKIKNIIAKQNFSSPDEMNTFLNDKMEDMNDGIFDDDEFDDDPLSQAQDLIYEARECLYAKDRVMLAKEALEISPDCADAYCILAEDKAKKIIDKKNYYQLGLEAGQRALGSAFFRENKGHVWGLIVARPFMRAKLGLALTLWDLSEKNEAISHCWDLLELNHSDNQGVRYILINFLVETKNQADIEKLFKFSPDDGSTMWLYPKALALFQKEGNSKKANKALSEAFGKNPHVTEYLFENNKIPKKLPDHYSWGSKEEAILYAAEGLKSWQVTDGALEWLKNNIPKSPF